MGKDKRKQQISQGDRLHSVVWFLKQNKGFPIEAFANKLGIKDTTLPKWYQWEVLPPVCWRKLKPLLLEYNINEEYIRGTSLEIENTDQKTPLEKNIQRIEQKLDELTRLFKASMK